MTDSEIMLELVKLKILNAREMSWHLIDHVGDVIAVFTDARLAVQDWRVAGALMEKVDSIRIDHLEGWVTVDTQTKFGAVEFEGNPVRAINEACVEALSD